MPEQGLDIGVSRFAESRPTECHCCQPVRPFYVTFLFRRHGKARARTKRRESYGAQRTLTDEGGHFELLNITPTYDLTIVSPEHGNVTLYKGLRRRDPWLVHRMRPEKPIFNRHLLSKSPNFTRMSDEACTSIKKQAPLIRRLPKDGAPLEPGVLFTWSPVAQAIYGLHLVPTFWPVATSPRIDVYTSIASAKWPDLRGFGVQFPQFGKTDSTTYEVSIIAEGPYASLDAAVDRAGLSAKRSTESCCETTPGLQCYFSIEGGTVETQELWSMHSATTAFRLRPLVAADFQCRVDAVSYAPGDLETFCTIHDCSCVMLDQKAQFYCTDGWVPKPRGAHCEPSDMCCLMMQQWGVRRK